MRKPYAKLHLAVFLGGFTGVLGKLILLPEGPLVWWRMCIASVLFSAYLRFRGQLPRIRLCDALKICGVGALTAIHWLFFYGSIKYSNVSIGVVCLALSGFFTAILEPLFNKKPPSWRELSFGLASVLGIGLMFHFDSHFRTGIILGVFSAAFAALLAIGIKSAGKKQRPDDILLFQMLGGFAFLTLTAPLYLTFFPQAQLLPQGSAFLYLLLMSSVCTIGLFLLEIQALQNISAFTVNLTYNLEPVYSIILAILFLGEASELGWPFFTGLALICASVLLQTLCAMRQTGSISGKAH
ncbi:MAG: DMT family transporter [Deltaproteobacteria bacterium]|jgi:drug/metabolite transporter (DMT)-like permease|nr:DMT family transporter [Deltaproteobacteria bacterium]